jgi:serine/threonine-protein kinase
MFAPSPSAQAFVSTSLREQLQATLEGSYVLERELGGGGMSRVFLAEETTLGRRVVVKVLAPELTEGMSAERFAREVRVAARLQHPNIVPLLAAGERDGLAYYTMPFVEGESLRARLGREGRLHVDVAISVLRDVARALEYAHEHGVVHRDIKPDNILLTRSAASVADFGIAKALHAARTAAPSGTGDDTGAPHAPDETLTRVGSSLGTPAYMAPEQAAGDPDVDARADVYAWGVVAYELLAGAPPFAGRAAHQLVAAHIGEPPPPLAARAPRAPLALVALVMRCLEKDPARRPQSAGELLAELEAAPTPSLPQAPPATTTPRRLTRIAAVAVAAIMLVALAVPAAMNAWRARRAAASGAPMLAVLPFENLGLPADAYFADGLTDEVRSRLAGVAGLRVIGGTSARQYKGTTKSVREIARELGATHVLTGTVRWERTAGGGRVRVSPELVRASDQATVWAAPVDGALDDVFAMQTQVAERVAAALDVTLLAGERRAVAARRTKNPAAYDAYLRGVAASTMAGAAAGGGMRPAIAELERAVALDHSFTLAHARLAQAYTLLISLGGIDPAIGRSKALESAARAWALDSMLVETRLARAASLTAAGDGRGVQMLRALAADAPGNAEVFLQLAIAEEQFGRTDRGIEAALASTKLDPRSAAAFGRLADLYDRSHRHEEAIRAREQEIALTPDNGIAYVAQAWSYLLWRADTAKARNTLERGGPKMEAEWPAWMVSYAPSAPALWHAVLPPATLRARDTLTLDGYRRATNGGTGPEMFYFYYMKLRHFRASGRTAGARAYAESLVVRATPMLRERDDVSMFSHSLRLALAEADAELGRTADAAREADRVVAQASAMDLPAALTVAAYVDVLIGRRDSAVARLTKALQLPAGQISVSRAMLRADPSWAPLRGHPGFESLIAERD